jgi:hypothetical protein
LKGSFRLIANHKMMVFDKELAFPATLPSWKKLRKEWTVK